MGYGFGLFSPPKKCVSHKFCYNNWNILYNFRYWGIALSKSQLNFVPGLNWNAVMTCRACKAVSGVLHGPNTSGFCFFLFRCDRDGKKQGKSDGERWYLWTSQIAPQMPSLQATSLHCPTVKGTSQETFAKMTLQINHLAVCLQISS